MKMYNKSVTYPNVTEACAAIKPPLITATAAPSNDINKAFDVAENSKMAVRSADAAFF